MKKSAAPLHKTEEERTPFLQSAAQLFLMHCDAEWLSKYHAVHEHWQK